MSHFVSHADFDVVTGSSMAQRRVPLPQPPSGSLDNKSDPAAPLATPEAPPRDAEAKRR